MDNLEKLKAYQAWRRGGESSIFDTMTAAEIGSVIDWAIDKCEQSEQVERERDMEQQKIGAASFKSELQESVILPFRPHIECVFQVWLGRVKAGE